LSDTLPHELSILIVRVIGHIGPMPRARKRQVSLSDTPYYHCVSRCVRRAFLCGTDPVTGFDFSHRRGWIVKRLKFLVSVFAIDLCAFAIMSNHYHVVLRVDCAAARGWSDQEVAERWLRLFAGPELAKRWLDGDALDPGQKLRVIELIATWRERLYNLSWFMRCLNEPIARMANREDRCTGRFWEGRFKSQALLDERALLACMAYVDLNPIRAAMARTPEHSKFTSIVERIGDPAAPALRPFSGHADDTHGIPYRFADYLELVDWAGRAIHPFKKGLIPPDTPPILQRLGMEPDNLLDYVCRKPDAFPVALGPVHRLRLFAHSLGQKFVRGMGQGRRLCPDSA
jgi:REP element-mobilizing transposase RayT